MSDMKCPYCGAGQNVCHDDGQGYEEGLRHEHECSECGKYFVFETYMSFDYTPSKADCLNDAPHELRLSNTYPKRFSRMRCRHCEFSRQLTPEEFAENGIELPEIEIDDWASFSSRHPQKAWEQSGDHGAGTQRSRVTNFKEAFLRGYWSVFQNRFVIYSCGFGLGFLIGYMEWKS